ncbi:hypothetical protein EDD27_9810 [Nonomuraea polychroma]|uniref:HEAT repeat protein n=1 Tax=Nonomuraea polychroma TaxID=46176 RepID=A0A438MMA1_9ACTN|nr:hypothetical protein EDD27_9810 [Nonomuraea polychroma]
MGCSARARLVTLVACLRAATDSLGHLQRLSDDDDTAWVETVEHLYGSVTHQSSVYSATAPAALVVADLLANPQFDQSISVNGWQPEPVRAYLLSFLAVVAEGTEPDRTESELWEAYCTPRKSGASSARNEEPDTEGYEAIIQCRAASPALVDPVLQCLTDHDLHTRVAATTTAALLCQVPTVASRRTEIITLIESRARNADTSYEKAKTLVELDQIGAVNRDFLFDQDPRIRLLAASASNLADDPDGTRVILDAIADPDQFADWYPDPHLLLLGTDDHSPSRLISEAVRRVPDFAELLPTALAVAARAGHSTGYPDWGLLLEAAFPPPQRFSANSPLNEAQRAYLQALLDNNEIWRPGPLETFWTPDKLFTLVRLPYDRQLLAAIVNSSDN